MKQQIVSRWDSTKVLFECELPADLDSGLAMRHALEKAVEAKANLRGSNLRDSNLRGSDLSGSNLRGSNLRDSDLRDSDLTPIRDDIWAVLSAAPAEVSALIDALKNGRVDGSTYVGECACLVGTIAVARQKTIGNLGALKPNSSRPAERFFLGISNGDTPETNQFSKLALEWSQEWLLAMQSTFATPAKADQK